MLSLGGEVCWRVPSEPFREGADQLLANAAASQTLGDADLLKESVFVFEAEGKRRTTGILLGPSGPLVERCIFSQFSKTLQSWSEARTRSFRSAAEKYGRSAESRSVTIVSIMWVRMSRSAQSPCIPEAA